MCVEGGGILEHMWYESGGAGERGNGRGQRLTGQSAENNSLLTAQP